jgi:hypothetical protein
VAGGCSDAANLGSDGVGGGSGSASVGGSGGTESTDEAGTGGVSTSPPPGGSGGAGGDGAPIGNAGLGGGSPGGAGSSGTAGSGGWLYAEPVAWIDTGWVDPSTNAVSIQGGWTPVDDCGSAIPLGVPCTTWDPSLDSAGHPGFLVDPTQACIRGVAAQVEDGHYGPQWGAALALPLNTEAEVQAPLGAYDALAHRVHGFVFNVTGTAPANIRVNVVTVNETVNLHHKEFALGTPEIVVRWDDPLFTQGFWVQNPEPFEVHQILNLLIQVATNESAPTPFDFCISNLRALVAAP